MKGIALQRAAVPLGLGVALSGCAHIENTLPPADALTPEARREAIQRARVWSATDIPTLDLTTGPAVEGSFAFDEWVACDYKETEPSGRSPKFVCETSPGHPVKVKYGAGNAEVFGEVLATRLFWALGFAADAMYPVRVRCRGCPQDPARSPERAGAVAEFDPAAIERKLPGRAMETRTDSGWRWSELEDVGPQAAPGARAERDALKLLAAFVQHTDSKAANQRLLCPKGEEWGRTGCRSPVLMVNDLGHTFGRGRWLVRKKRDSVNLAAWAQVPVWKDPARCVARLQVALIRREPSSGSLSHPRISEAGRAFLAGLLVQLSDAQLHDLFATARVNRRPRDPRRDGPPATVDEWVTAFKLKRAQIVDHRCPQ